MNPPCDACFTLTFCFTPATTDPKMPLVTAETFRPEIAEAISAYEKFVICIDKIPEDFETTLISLVSKATKAYEGRGPELRHGIALDKRVTVILSQNDGARPLCGIYFTLHSPYQKQPLAKPVGHITEPIDGTPSKSEG